MELKQIGKLLVVNIYGDVDHSNAISIRKEIDEAIKSREITDLLFNFSNLEFMDSSGIGMILGRYKIILSLDGRVYIAEPNESVRKIINVSGLHKIIPIYDNYKTAVKKISEVCNNEYKLYDNKI